MHDVDQKIADLGYTLPTPPKPVASYVPVVISGDLLVVSGQLPFLNGKLIATGPVPSVVTEEQAKQAAVQCTLNALAAIKDAIHGDWARLTRIVRVGVFVQSDDRFANQPAIANGASDLLAQIFGEAGRHARAAVGVNALPLDAAVEIELTAQIVPESK